ncbi:MULTISPECIES: hypothetical protein [Pseudolactococcus]|uniref:Phage protein n=2 Tax=Pseudolactococcus TaxID=3436058 RepID=A0ABT0APH6_9LACT|nr:MULTISPECIES: hypothetical protein [Lactococcus]MBQ2636476.1 hypothetical protein [Methanobrevibacter sp.]MCJ1978445.1 hypothetical protein [Lactococcus paracarnosus]MCJ1984589.1 hypothetical protein [Lactococcus paracarnosus]MCJ1999283.1 hypothetical protein [Lactococcus paracarnosus]
MTYYKVKVIGENSVFDDDYVISANSEMEVESDISTHYCGNDFSLAKYTITKITEKEYLANDDKRKF